MTFSQIQPISLRDQVVQQVRTAIIEGRLKPKDHVTEAALTRELGVSRTPVREALILLEREGLIVFMPNRGSFVRAFDSTAIDEIFSSRRILEDFAAEQIATRLTENDFAHLNSLIEQQRAAIDTQAMQAVRALDVAFHRYLIDLSGHSWLIRCWGELVVQVAALIHLRAAGLKTYDEYWAIEDHRAILDAYRSQDIALIQSVNQRINARVARECQLALAKMTTS